MSKDVVLVVYLDNLLFWTRAALERAQNSVELREIEKKIIEMREKEEMREP